MAAAAAHLEMAARIDDPVEHTGAFLGALIGAVVGIAVGIAIVAVFAVAGPLAIFALVGGLAVAGSGFGEMIGKKFFKHKAGDIAEGSLTVFVGGPDRNAARVKDKVKCHRGEYIVSGTRTIEIEGRKAARVTEETRCDGKIKKGCETVKYGGPSVQVYPKRFSGEIAPWFWVVRETVDWATTFIGLKGLITGWSKLRTIYKVISVVGTVNTFVGKGLSYTQMIAQSTGNFGLSKWIGDNITDTRWYQATTTAIGLTGLGKTYFQMREAKIPAVATGPSQQLALPAPEPQLALPAPKPQLALPAPKPQLALPAPKPQLALPAPKPQLALPAPPQQLALPAPPQQLALPAPPQQLALPAPPQQLALPAPPQQLALPAPQPQLALPAPEPQLALPGPSGGGTPSGGG